METTEWLSKNTNPEPCSAASSDGRLMSRARLAPTATRQGVRQTSARWAITTAPSQRRTSIDRGPEAEMRVPPGAAIAKAADLEIKRSTQQRKKYGITRQYSTNSSSYPGSTAHRLDH